MTPTQYIAVTLLAVVFGAAGYVAGYLIGMEKGYRLASKPIPSQGTQT